MLEIWRMPGDTFPERLASRERLTINSADVLARRIAKDPAHSSIQKEEPVYLLLQSSADFVEVP